LEKDRLHETIRDVFDRSEETNGTSLAADFIIWAAFSGEFGQLPAIFACDVTQDTLQIAQDSTMRLWAGMQMEKLLCPTIDIARGGLRANESGMLMVLHVLFLSFEISEKFIHLYRISYLKEKNVKHFSY
jgi:hypothetical protein